MIDPTRHLPLAALGLALALAYGSDTAPGE